jgi:20S proteasome subunit beta 4
LNWIDNLGTRAAVPYAAHGYGAYYTMSIFDRYHRDDISYEEGVDILRKCVAELEKRLPISSGGYLYVRQGRANSSVKVVDAKGVREVTDFDKPQTEDLMLDS